MPRSIKIYLVYDDLGDWKVEILQTLEDLVSRLEDLINSVSVKCLVHIGFGRYSSSQVSDVYDKASLLTGLVILTPETSLILSGFNIKALPTTLLLHEKNIYLLARVGETESQALLSCQSKLERLYGASALIQDNIQPDNVSPPYCAPSSDVSSNWIRDLRESAPDISTLLESRNIRTDGEYLRHESTLPLDIRFQIAKHRGNFLLSSKTNASVTEISKWLPCWEGQKEVVSSNLSQRTINVLRRNGVNTLSDIASYDEEKLLRFAGFGERCLTELRGFLAATLMEPRSLYPVSEDGVLSIPTYNTPVQPPLHNDSNKKLVETLEKEARANSALAQAIAKLRSQAKRDKALKMSTKGGLRESREVVQQSRIEAVSLQSTIDEAKEFLGQVAERLSALDDTEKTVLERRMGVKATQSTLQDLGDAFNVSRERIRQIETKAFKKIDGAELIAILDRRLREIKKSLVSPLTVSLLERLDPWFKGVESSKSVLCYLLDKSGTWSIQKLAGMEIIVSYPESAFKSIIQLMATTIKEGAVPGVRDSALKASASVYLTDSPELVDLVFKDLTDHIHWGPTHLDGSCDLLSVGRSAEAYAVAALEQADSPMDLQDLQQYIKKLYYVEIETRRLHNACGNKALLYGRGVYGVRKHLNIPDQQITEIKDLVIDYFDDLETDRQVRVSEILDATGISEIYSAVDEYKLAIVCEEIPSLQSLNRMMFIKRSGDERDRRARRIEILDAVEAILRESETPLHTKELKEKIAKQRGLSSFFQIFQKGNLVRVAPNTWGLNERHLGLRSDVETHLLEIIDITTRRAGTDGVGIDELKEVITTTLGSARLSSDDYLVTSLALKSGSSFKEGVRFFSRDIERQDNDESQRQVTYE